VVPSILAFNVNESLLDILHLAPLFERLFGDGKFLNDCVYTAHPLLGGNDTGRGALHTIL
jgi:hypothetical protein